MTLRHMRIFVAVCEAKSTTKAAEKLYMAQPAVSLAIKELEEYYGVKLFDRISKRLYLTDAGKYFFDCASHIVSLCDDIESNINSRRRSGKLKIGASITVGTKLIPGYVAMFKKRQPQIETEVFIGNSDLNEKKILQNELDFAIIEGLAHSENIVSRTYMKDKLVAICSPSDPLCRKDAVTIDELLTRPLLLREVGSGTRELFDHVMASFEYAYTPLWESTSNEAIINAVAKGLGVSVLSEMIVRDYLKQGFIAELKLEQLRFDRGFNIIYHKNKSLSGAAEEFIEMCVSCKNID